MSAKITIRAGLLALGVFTIVVCGVACGGNGNKSGNDAGTSTPSADMAQEPASPPDLAPPPCVMNPVTGNDFLNACTTAQTGDPAKNYPYFPKLAPNGNLPPTN